MRYLLILIRLCVFGILLAHVSAPDRAFARQQAGGIIQGTVFDQASRAPLPGVNVAVDGTTTGTITDVDGRFVLADLPPSTYRLSISMVGYETFHAVAIVRQDEAVVNLGAIVLTATSIPLSEIVVTPGQFSMMGSPLAPRQVLSERDIKNMSWAEDITRVVARLPGISSSDYSSKFTIRGGESDEVLITLDGMELYEPFHQRDFSGGLFSIIDVATIQGVELMTGGFSAAYGNRLSGVFNMRTRSPLPGKRNTSVGLSVIQSGIYTDGTFGGGRGSYLISARRGMLDALFSLVPAVEEATLDQGATPGFYDLAGKVQYALSAGQVVSFHVLRAGDWTKLEDISETGDFDKNDTRYGNTYGWLTLKSTFATTLFARTMLYSGHISHDRNGSFRKYEPSDKGEFTLSDRRSHALVGIKQDWSWHASDHLFVSGGLDAKYVDASYDYFSRLQEIRVDADERLYDFERTTDLNIHPTGRQLGAYMSGRLKLFPKLILETGLRYDHATYTDDRLWSPRVGLAYALSKGSVLRAAWGYYYQTQFINDLDVNHGDVMFDPAQLAKHYVLGFEHTFTSGVSLRLEGYYKDVSHYSPQWQNLRDHLEMFPEARNDNALVMLSGAKSRGIELFLKRDTGGKISWWLSYALAKAEDQVRRIVYDGLLSSRTGAVPRLNDQRHTVYADLNYRPNDRWHFNVSWQYYRGWPRTDYTYRYQALPNGDLHFYPVHKAFNGVLYPAFHRMDLRVNRRFGTTHGDVTTFLHLINVYNHQNLKKFDLDTRDDEGRFSIDEQGDYVPFHDDKYWFGFMPVLGVRWDS